MSDTPRYYFDYAAYTPILKEVKTKMDEVMDMRTQGALGNTNSKHKEGRASKKIIENVRDDIARILQVKSHTIYFTSCASEANIIGLFSSLTSTSKNKKQHIIISNTDHPSITQIEQSSLFSHIDITYVDPNTEGIVTKEIIEKELRPTTVLVSIGMVSPDTGATQPVKEISAMVKTYNNTIVVHSDVSSAMPFMHIHPQEYGIDIMVASGIKLYGPQVGILYINQYIKIEPLFFGGGQERGIRTGTHNVETIAGLGEAVTYMHTHKDTHTTHIKKIRDHFLDKLEQKIPHIHIHGNKKTTSPQYAYVHIPDIDNNQLAVILDTKGFALSNAVSCSDTSSVLLSMYKDSGHPTTGIRVTFGLYSSIEETELLINAIVDAIT